MSDKKARVERRLKKRQQDKLIAEMKEKRNHFINGKKKKA